MRYLVFLLFVCVSTIAIANQSVIAKVNEQEPDEKPASATVNSSQPYCGLYCLYTVMKVAGNCGN